jgi:hypothetical protein
MESELNYLRSNRACCHGHTLRPSPQRDSPWELPPQSESYAMTDVLRYCRVPCEYVNLGLKQAHVVRPACGPSMDQSQALGTFLTLVRCHVDVNVA